MEELIIWWKLEVKILPEIPLTKLGTFGRNKQYNCGRLALLAKKKKQIAERTLRRDTISKLKIRKILPDQVKPHK